ncbi:hypothetical protein LTR66_007605 [Elasticomyces elasticus]|nr:hypothetical protein LTR66_007605 [Elasticomyces elasticus]KAK4992519.1 hypothetical protein LTR50_001061 [Elasticomyces elasticus]KAK5010468.1 hypothetical protein LTR28_009729 [Elasticomyces elasticus]
MSSFFRSDSDATPSEESTSRSSTHHSSGKTQENGDPNGEAESLKTLNSTSTEHSIAGDQDLETLVDSVPNQRRHRDFLLHALLEEKCLNEALELYSTPVQLSKDHPKVKAAATAKYYQLCDHLGSYGLVAANLYEETHAKIRQQYRDGLDYLSASMPTGSYDAQRELPQGSFTALIRASNSTRAPPVPLQRLLSAPETTRHGTHNKVWKMGTAGPSPIPGQLIPYHSLLDSTRYQRDFHELGMLGKGGYGSVYRVAHKLDGLQYAVKKIPLSIARLDRIQQRGEFEMDALLLELRTIARLDHPNLVRYYSGWIECSFAGSQQYDTQRRSLPRKLLPGGEHTSPSFDPDQATAGADATDATGPISSNSSLDAEAEYGDNIIFEYSGSNVRSVTPVLCKQSQNGADKHAQDISRAEISGDSTSLTTSGTTTIAKPILTLHIQMSLHPLTLASCIAPAFDSNTNTDDTPSLQHCFHIESSIHLLLAILDGVEYLHAEGIVHRDLKPGNVFLSVSTNTSSHRGSVDLSRCKACGHTVQDKRILEVRIGDFGLVTAIACPDVGPLTTPSKHVGTELYRPLHPPQYPHAGLDIFALGVIAFELLWPFSTRMERHETLQKLRRGEFPADFSRSTGDPSGIIQRCIEGMICERDADRLSCAEVRQGLWAALAQCHGCP